LEKNQTNGQEHTKKESVPHFEKTQLLDTPTTLRGGVNECGDVFPKTSLLHKKSLVNIQHFLITIVFIYNKLDVNTYQKNISASYHQQIISTRNEKNTRCMYNFSFYYGLQFGGFSTTNEYSTTLQEH
jgi:hypothetical protein